MKHSITYQEINPSDIEQLDNDYHVHTSKLDEFAKALLWWNQKINLLSRDVSRETIHNHLLHSLCVRLSPGFQEQQLIVDAGTGGGLPGIPLAITSPEKTFVLNDIVTKKITAVKQICRTLNLHNTTGTFGSIENIDPTTPFTVVTKHAFKIPDLIGMIAQKPWKSIVMLKGHGDVESELHSTETALDVKILKLDALTPNDFFTGKGLVEIRKK